MKKKILFCLMLALAACNQEPASRYYDGYEYADGYEFVDAASIAVDEQPCTNGNGMQIAYSTPNGNDLKLETNNTVLHVAGAPGRQYAYYVWAGGRETTDDPDLIIDQGNAAVLISQ